MGVIGEKSFPYFIASSPRDDSLKVTMHEEPKSRGPLTYDVNRPDLFNACKLCDDLR